MNCNKLHEDCNSCSKCKCTLHRSNTIGVIYDNDITLDQIKESLHYFFNKYDTDSKFFKIYYLAPSEEYCQKYGLDQSLDHYFRTLGNSNLNFWKEFNGYYNRYIDMIKTISTERGAILNIRKSISTLEFEELMQEEDKYCNLLTFNITISND